jgi:aspartyl/asparaginyl-tRNA synthetase
MIRTEIRRLWEDAAGFGEQIITICGWVRTLRHSGAIAFVEISDGSCFKGLQVVAAEEETTKLFRANPSKCRCCVDCQRPSYSDTASETAF